MYRGSHPGTNPSIKELCRGKELTNYGRSHIFAHNLHAFFLSVGSCGHDADSCSIADAARVPCSGRRVAPIGECWFERCEPFECYSRSNRIVDRQDTPSNLDWDDLICKDSVLQCLEKLQPCMCEGREVLPLLHDCARYRHIRLASSWTLCTSGPPFLKSIPWARV